MRLFRNRTGKSETNLVPRGQREISQLFSKINVVVSVYKTMLWTEMGVTSQ